jgi:L-ascorbate metabolism protein UlaG (beta-lactamase superfamily)
VKLKVILIAPATSQSDLARFRKGATLACHWNSQYIRAPFTFFAPYTLVTSLEFPIYPKIMSHPSPEVSVEIIPGLATKEPPSHHIGSPPKAFRNPWPTAKQSPGLLKVLYARFGPKPNFIPLPESRDELVPIRTPNWGNSLSGLKATWFGHASFLIETSTAPESSRGIRLFLDPVLTDRMGPYNMVGPKRFSHPPCTIEEVPEIDIVVISHNHYDHLDLPTVKAIHRSNPHAHFFCGLNLKAWFTSCGIAETNVTELDWWDSASVNVSGIGSVSLTCTPAQHSSARGPFDREKTLWCSWVIEEPSQKNIFFAGDTGYRTIDEKNETADEWDTLPGCPAFAEIGDKYGPFDLALLPIGCYNPRAFLSTVHCSPMDSIRIHKDIRSKKSVGMHYGTLRGGISGHYEDVRLPPKDWKAACEKVGLTWGSDISVCDIGETVVV